jgi:hypothetical protein
MANKPSLGNCHRMTALNGWGDSDEDQACLRVAIRPIYAAGAKT